MKYIISISAIFLILLSFYFHEFVFRQFYYIGRFLKEESAEGIVFLFSINIVSAISLILTFCWTKCQINAKKMIHNSYAVFFLLITANIIIAYIEGGPGGIERIAEVYLAFFFIPLSLLLSLVFYWIPWRKIKYFSLVFYMMNMALLLIGSGWMTSAGTTWGNSNLYFGIFIVLHLVLMLQIYTYNHPFNFTYGIAKVAYGVIAGGVLIIWGFPISQWVTSDVMWFRKSLVLMIILFFFEGILLIYKAKREKRSSGIL